MLRIGKIQRLYGTINYDEESSNNEYELAVFVRNEDGTFDRFEEEHYHMVLLWEK